MAEHFGVSKKLILNRMKEYGIERRKNDTAYWIAQWAHLGSAEIAKRLQLRQSSICQTAKANGIKVYDPYHKGHITTHNGYKMIPMPDHPQADSKGYIREHRWVAEQKLGRLISEDEVVHHINGDKLDNRPENLEVMLAAEHVSHHFKGSRWENGKRILKHGEDIV